MVGGDASAIYDGIVVDDTPTSCIYFRFFNESNLLLVLPMAIPTITLPNISIQNHCDAAKTTDPHTNNTLEIIITHRLLMYSLQ